HFEQAIERDPQYGLAYAGLADCYWSLGLYNNAALPPKIAMPRALAAAGKALELDPELAEPHTTIGVVTLCYDWNVTAHAGGLQRSLEKKPGYGQAHHWYAHTLLVQGRLGEALAESRRFIELDPLDPHPIMHLGWHYLMTHQWEASWETLQYGLSTPA